MSKEETIEGIYAPLHEYFINSKKQHEFQNYCVQHSTREPGNHLNSNRNFNGTLHYWQFSEQTYFAAPGLLQKLP